MSREYREMVDSGKKVDMRTWCQRPGRQDGDGKPLYTTEQHHKNRCDVNKIIKKYDKSGLLIHLNKIEAKFGDMTGADFKAMQDKVANAKTMFEMLPSDIRNRFDNNPALLLRFMEDKENREEAIEIGLIKSSTDEEKDGLGEHVVDGEKVEKE